MTLLTVSLTAVLMKKLTLYKLSVILGAAAQATLIVYLHTSLYFFVYYNMNQGLSFFLYCCPLAFLLLLIVYSDNSV
jgi:hypothetical protein